MKIDSSCLEQYMFRSLCSLWEILSEIYINEPPALDYIEVCSKLYPGMLILVVKELFLVILLSDIQIMSNLVLIKLRNSLSLSICRAREDIFRCMTVSYCD